MTYISGTSWWWSFCRLAGTGAADFNSALCRGYVGRRDRRPCGDVPQRRPASPHKDLERITAKIGGRRREETDMKQPTFHGRVLLPLSGFADARAGDPLAMERILRYYDGYMNKLCTRTLYDLDGTPHVRVDEYMKHRLQNKLIRAILKDSL